MSLFDSNGKMHPIVIGADAAKNSATKENAR